MQKLTWYSNIVVIKNQPKREEMVNRVVGGKMTVDTGGIGQLKNRMHAGQTRRDVNDGAEEAVQPKPHASYHSRRTKTTDEADRRP